MAAPADAHPKNLRGLDAESRQMVVDLVEQLKNRLLTKEKILEFDQEEYFPEETIRKMMEPEIGLQLLFIPEEYGGMGGGARDCCAVTQTMAQICLGVGTAFFAIQLGADPIIVGGTEAQKEKWLGAIVREQALVAYAVTEPGAGSNLAALQTKADPVRDDDGTLTGYIVNGAKQFISTGGYADFITLLANTPEGPSFFIVERGAEGFARGKSEIKHGIRASNTSPLSFTDVFVPIENLIGGVPGLGLKQANKVFGYTRVMVAAMALGAGKAALEIVIPYAKDRVQFGAPLCQKQGYTHKLVVPHAVRLEAAAAYIEAVAAMLDSGDADLQVEGAIAKLFTTEAANNAADDAMQALGGYGYITEYEVEKIKRDVKITCIYEGTSEIQQNIISTFRWKKTWKTKGGFYRSIQEDMTALDPALPGAGCRFYGMAADALNQLITWVQSVRLTKQQYVMFALADMMAHVEVGAALGKKAAAHHQSEHPETDKMVLMSRIFANETAQLVGQNMLKILMGSGLFDHKTIRDQLAQMGYHELISGYRDVIPAMDRLAGILFA